MSITKEEWAKLTPEQQNELRLQLRQEYEDEKRKQAEARRFVEMNLIVKAQQGKRYEPTEQARHMVKKMATFGFTLKQIADVIGVGVSSLQKHFKRELETGHVEANFMVANRLFEMALNGDTTACIFWCKTRLKWKETSRHEHAFDPTGVDQPGLDKFTEDDLAALYSILHKARKVLPAA